MSDFYQCRSPFSRRWLKIRASDGEIIEASEHPWHGLPHAADLDWARPRDEAGNFLKLPVPHELSPWMPRWQVKAA